MQKIVARGLVLTLAFVISAAGTTRAYDFTGDWLDFDCDGYTLHAKVGGDPSLVEVRRAPDGSIRISGSDGTGVVASCSYGCLELSGKAACNIGRPHSTRGADVSCPGGNTFTMSGGDDPNARCDAAQAEDGSVTGASCSDGNGNTSKMDCRANGGDGSCVSQTGSGECKCKTCDR